jgi:hypothetical protein
VVIYSDYPLEISSWQLRDANWSSTSSDVPFPLMLMLAYCHGFYFHVDNSNSVTKVLDVDTSKCVLI